MPRTQRTVVRPPPEPDGYFVWLGEWERIHPIRAAICLYCLFLLASFAILAGF